MLEGPASSRGCAPDRGARCALQGSVRAVCDGAWVVARGWRREVSPRRRLHRALVVDLRAPRRAAVRHADPWAWERDGHAGPAGAAPRLYDFFVDTPGLGLDGEVEPHFVPVVVEFPASTQEFNVGRGSVAVPGTLPGYLAGEGIQLQFTYAQNRCICMFLSAT